jgi:hypothetical protein
MRGAWSKRLAPPGRKNENGFSDRIWWCSGQPAKSAWGPSSNDYGMRNCRLCVRAVPGAWFGLRHLRQTEKRYLRNWRAEQSLNLFPANQVTTVCLCGVSHRLSRFVETRFVQSSHPLIHRIFTCLGPTTRERNLLSAKLLTI